MNAPMRKLAAVCLVLFMALLGNATWVQVGQAHHLDTRPSNPRPLIERFSRHRGDILTSDGRQLATSTPLRGTGANTIYKRGYPTPDPAEYANVTGWAGVDSTTDLEQSEDELLSGTDSRLAIRNLTDTILGKQTTGGYVTSSIDRGAQDAAWNALSAIRKAGGHAAVVALDVKTGAVLALVSTPSFDPTPLASNDGATVQAAYNKLSKDPNQPLLDRATQTTYPPGSFFKLVTSAAALSTGDTPDTMIASPPVLKLPLTSSTLTNFGGESCGGAMITLAQALKISCNTAFGQLGLNLGATTLRTQATAFGIGSTVPNFPLPNAASTFPANPDAPQTAFSAIGQYDVQLSPLQAAMIVQSIADGGTEMTPYLVAQEHAPDGSVISGNPQHTQGQPITASVASDLRQMMVGVTAPGGTAYPFIQRTAGSIPTAGKTGTAQNTPGAAPHAWFGGFAPVENPQVAVAVFVEHGGTEGSEATGGSVSAPIAGAVLKAVVCERTPTTAGC